MLFSKIFCGNFVEIENFSNLELDLKATVKTTKIETILKKQPSTFKVQTDPNWQIQKSHTRARISCSWNKDECSINSKSGNILHVKLLLSCNQLLPSISHDERNFLTTWKFLSALEKAFSDIHNTHIITKEIFFVLTDFAIISSKSVAINCRN